MTLDGDDERAGPRPEPADVAALIAAVDGAPVDPGDVVVSSTPAEGWWLAAHWEVAAGARIEVRLVVVEAAADGFRLTASVGVQTLPARARASLESLDVADFDGDGLEEVLLVTRATCGVRGGCDGIGESARYVAVSAVPPRAEPEWAVQLDSESWELDESRSGSFAWVFFNEDSWPDIDVQVLVRPRRDLLSGLDEGSSSTIESRHDRVIFQYFPGMDRWRPVSDLDGCEGEDGALALGSLAHLLGALVR